MKNQYDFENYSRKRMTYFESRLWKKYTDTTSYKKSLNYFKYLIDQKDFIREIADIRKRYRIPTDGITKITYVKNKYIKIWGGPNEFVKLPKNIKKVLPKLSKESEKLGNKYHLDKQLLLYWIIFKVLANTYLPTQFYIDDFQDLVEPHIYGKNKKPSIDINNLRDIGKNYPIAIFISPYSSERELIDYIKKLYRLEIKPLKEKYSQKNIKIGKIKKRDPKKNQRDKLIFHLRNFPKKEIVGVVAKHFGKVMDYTYINKIISKEKGKDLNT